MINADVFGATLTIDTGSNQITNAGTFEATDGSKLVIDSAIDNTGTGTAGIVANGGTVDVDAVVTGTGAASISDYGVLDFQFGVSSGQTVAFDDGTGTLEIGHPSSFGAAISNFGAGNTVDLTNYSYSPDETPTWTENVNNTGGTLVINNGSQPAETIHLSGVYTPERVCAGERRQQRVCGAGGTDVLFNYVPFNTAGSSQSNGVYTPVISNAGSTIQVTDGNNYGEASSWFADAAPVSVNGNFTASFDYQAIGYPSSPPGLGPADGIALTFARLPPPVPRPWATPAVGWATAAFPPARREFLDFNIYSGHTPGTNFATDGSTGTYNSTLPVDFWDTGDTNKGDTVQVVLNYNASTETLTKSLTDVVNGNAYSTSYHNINLVQVLGSDTAYVGFSAADGSGASTQFISNFTFESASSSSPVDTWTNHTGDGEWITSGNWSGGGAPGPDELALINSGGTPEIAFDVTLDGVALVNYGAIGLTNSGTTLTLDDGAIINGEATGTLTINQHNAVDVEAGHDGGSALFDGLNVYDYGSLDVGDQNPNAVLTLDDGSAIPGGGTGQIIINAGSTLDAEPDYQTQDPTLDAVSVTVHGALDVGDVSTGAILTLDDGTKLFGDGIGTLTVNFGSSVDVEAGDNGAGSGATFNNLIVTNNGAITVGTTASGAVLNLDHGTAATGGTLTINNGSSATFDDASASGTGITVGEPESLHGDQRAGRHDGVYAYEINASGEIVGYFYDANEDEHGFLYTGAGAFTQLDDPSAVSGTVASGIDSSGVIVGSFVDNHNFTDSFVVAPDSNGNYDANAYVQLDDPSAAFGTLASSINGSGAIVGYFYDSGYIAHGFVYDGSLTTVDTGAFITLNDPNASGGTSAAGINNAGDVVGHYFNANNQPVGFLATPEGGGTYDYTDLSDPFAVYGLDATGINNNGDVVGYYYDANSNIDGFIYENGVYYNVSNSYISAINNSGEAVGFNDLGDSFSLMTPAIMTLADGAVVTGGSIAVGPASALEIAPGDAGSGSGATLDGVAVTNDGGIFVDPTDSGAVLTLDDGATITSGTLTISSSGGIDVEIGSNGSTNAATFDGVSVVNGNVIEVDEIGGAGAILTLEDGALMSGGSFNIAPLDRRRRHRIRHLWARCDAERRHGQ